VGQHAGGEVAADETAYRELIGEAPEELAGAAAEVEDGSRGVAA
jgi:hypothetical protein